MTLCRLNVVELVQYNISTLWKLSNKVNSFNPGRECVNKRKKPAFNKAKNWVRKQPNNVIREQKCLTSIVAED